MKRESALDLAARMEKHVRARLPGSAPVIENGAWQMMLDAAKALREIYEHKRDEDGACKLCGFSITD